jgi:hypothetical protein
VGNGDPLPDTAGTGRLTSKEDLKQEVSVLFVRKRQALHDGAQHGRAVAATDVVENSSSFKGVCEVEVRRSFVAVLEQFE